MFSAFRLALYDGVDLKIAPWIRQYVKSQVGGQGFTKCLQDFKPAEQIEAAVTDKLLDVAGLSGFVEVFDAVTKIGSVILTPEKFQFRIEYRAGINRVFPRTINLYDKNSSLTIDGDWLMNLDPIAATPCSGDGWCPSLVVIDQPGEAFNKRNVVEIQLNESHRGPPPAICGLGCSSLEIPISDLGALQGLVSGPVQVELAVSDASFSSYPGGNLRIPVPGVMTLQTKAKIYSVHPPLVKPGEDIVVKGTGFDSYGETAIYQLTHPQDLGQGIVLRKKESSSNSDSKAVLTVPLSIPLPLQPAYTLIVIPGLDATEEDLQDLEYADPLLVTNLSLPLVVVGDHGIARDDRMRVEFLDANDNIVAGQEPVVTLSFDLPKDGPTPGSDKLYVFGQTWDDLTLRDDGNLRFITAPISKVLVRCESPGLDGSCTWGIRSLRKPFCWASGIAPRPAFSHKVSQGVERIYNLVPIGTAICP